MATNLTGKEWRLEPPSSQQCVGFMIAEPDSWGYLRTGQGVLPYASTLLPPAVLNVRIRRTRKNKGHRGDRLQGTYYRRVCLLCGVQVEVVALDHWIRQ